MQFSHSRMTSVAPGLRCKWRFEQFNMWLGWVDQVAAFRLRHIFRNQIWNHLRWFQIRSQIRCVHLGAIHTGLIYHDLNETFRVLSDNSNCFSMYEDSTVMSCGCKKRNQIPSKSVFSIRHCKRFAVGMNTSVAAPFQMAIKYHWIIIYCK